MGIYHRLDCPLYVSRPRPVNRPMNTFILRRIPSDIVLIEEHPRHSGCPKVSECGSGGRWCVADRKHGVASWDL